MTQAQGMTGPRTCESGGTASDKRSYAAYSASKRELITGGVGFIGSCLSKRLQTGGADIHMASRHGGADDGSGIYSWRADLSRTDETDALFERVRPNVVFQLASGCRPVDWVYVSDIADGLVAMGTQPGIDGETIALGSGHLTTVRDVVETLTRLIGNGVAPQFGALPERAAEVVRQATHGLRSRRLAGNRPSVWMKG
jgi:nucleoside-diphosphate-sugar epimerase